MAGTLAALCGNAAIGIFVCEELDSSNAEALRRLRAGAGTPFVVFAKRQTAGRGRGDHRWESPAGNIYASFAFRPNIAPQGLCNFTTWLGVCVCRMLNETFGVPATVKWPNDIWVDGKKLSGTLTEVETDPQRVRAVVYGIGLNVAGTPENLSSPAVALADCVPAGTPLSSNAVAARLIETVLDGAERFFAGGIEEDLALLWEKYDGLRNREISAVHGNEAIAGTARGIDGNGNLKIECDGRICIFSAGDVSLLRPCEK